MSKNRIIDNLLSIKSEQIENLINLSVIFTNGVLQKLNF